MTATANLEHELLAADTTLENLVQQTGISIDELHEVASLWSTDGVPEYTRRRVSLAISHKAEASIAKYEAAVDFIAIAGITVSIEERAPTGRKYWVCTLKTKNVDTLGIGVTAVQRAWSPWRALCLAAEQSGVILDVLRLNGVSLREGNLSIDLAKAEMNSRGTSNRDVAA